MIVSKIMVETTVLHQMVHVSKSVNDMDYI